MSARVLYLLAPHLSVAATRLVPPPSGSTHAHLFFIQVRDDEHGRWLRLRDQDWARLTTLGPQGRRSTEPLLPLPLRCASALSAIPPPPSSVFHRHLSAVSLPPSARRIACPSTKMQHSLKCGSMRNMACVALIRVVMDYRVRPFPNHPPTCPCSNTNPM